MLNRKLLLSDEITNTTIKDIIEKILEINNEDEENENKLKDFQRKPISLFINSGGGIVYDGLALIDIIKNSKTPVYTICIGRAMSMGLWIWISGKKKLIGKNATLLFHDVSAGISGKAEYIEQELEEILRLQQKSIKEIVENSEITEETLKDYITRKADWYIPAEEALKLHLADEYYE